MRSVRGRRAVALAVGVVLTIAVTMMVGNVVLGLHGPDEALMLRLLIGSATVALAVGGVGLFLLRGRSWDRLGLRIAVSQVVCVVVALICVLPTTLVMFSSTHDRNLVYLLLGYSLMIALIFAASIGASLGDAVETIRAGATRMAAGDLSARVPRADERELNDLATAFNTMAERLQAAFARQHQLEEDRQSLIAAVSHDLRTPIASLRLMVEAIADGVVDDPMTIRRYVAAMDRETVSLGRLIDDLFEMSRLEAGRLPLRLTAVPLGPLVTETLAVLEAQADRRGVLMRTRVDAALPPVMIDPDRIQRVLVNLIQNAIHHTPADGSITVDAVEVGSDVRVTVRDTGEGISTADLPHVFEQFFRGDKARSRDDERGGAGLGLAISRQLIEAHGGRIWAAQPTDGGAILSFTLPKVSA